MIYAWLAGTTFMAAIVYGSEGEYRRSALNFLLSALLAYVALKGETP